MNLREEILKDHSKARVSEIVAWIGTDKKRLQELIQLFLHDEYRVVQWSAFVVGIIGELHPELIQSHLPAMLKRMKDKGVHGAVKRNVVRILQYVDIHEALQGDVMNICFDALADPKEAIAVRCFSMTVLDNLSRIYPDIRQELLTIIHDELEHDPSPAFRARAKQVLKTKK